MTTVPTPPPAPPPIPPLLVRIEQKLEESEFFLQQMIERENVNLNAPNDAEKQYRFFVSAFLNAVRSPLQYILEEFIIPGSSPISFQPAQKAWYDASITGRPVLGFLKKERDSNIHVMRTTPVAHHVVSFDIEETHELHQEWPTYTGTNKRVTSIGRDAIDKVIEIVEDGKVKGHIS